MERRLALDATCVTDETLDQSHRACLITSMVPVSRHSNTKAMVGSQAKSKSNCP
jgi:hypothetical protein